MLNQPPNQAGLSGEVRDKLYAVRSQLGNFKFLLGTLQFLILALAIMIGVGVVDYYWPLQAVIRTLALLSLGAGAIIGLVRWIKHRDQIDDLMAAKEVEIAHPELGQRLRTAHQYDRALAESTHIGATAPALTSALLEETNRRAAGINFSDTVRWRALLSRTVAIGATGFLLLMILIFYRETRTTLARMFLLPVHYSNLQYIPLEPTVAGSTITVNATATGRPLKKVELWVRRSGSTEWAKQPMLPADADADTKEAPTSLTGELNATIENCKDDLVYKVVARPLPTSTHRLKVLQPLIQEKFTATIEPPSYTGVERETKEQMDLDVVEGSLVSWEMQLNREPASANLVTTDKSGEQGTPSITIDGKRLFCDLSQLEQTQQFEVHAIAADGMEFTSDRIRIRVKQDQGPSVVFQKPEEELEVTATTEIGLRLHVVDDFGIGKVGIEYQINDGEVRMLWEEDLQGQKRELTALPVMYLEDHELNYDDAITYFAFADDNRDTPKRTRSELQFIDVRPYKREYQVVESNCQGGGACLSLEELIKRQRHTLRRTFANLDRQPIQDALSTRLSTSQREIMVATEEFTQGWEREFGSMPSLHAATESMLGAVVQLEQKLLDPAMPLEESALANLVKARQNVRKFLKDCKNPGQFSQCVKYDTEMVQKIRAPQKKDNAADESMAEARDQIQKLAEQQRRFSEDVAAGGGGAQLEKQPNTNQSSSASPAKTGSSGQFAKLQQAASQQAQQMQQSLQRNDVASELAQQRMDQAAQEIEESAQQLRDGDAMLAAREALAAAELLEQLDEHLEGLSAADLSQRLAIAEQMASRLSTAETKIAESLERQSESSDPQSLSNTQAGLAQQAETLADLIRHLEADALGEEPQLRQGLREIESLHQPEEVARDMDRIAQQIADDEGEKAAKGARYAADTIEKIANELATLRRAIMQPRLEELMAAEALAASVLQGIREDRPQSELVAQYEQLQKQLSVLNISASQPASQPAGAKTGAGSNSSSPGQGNGNASVGSSGGSAAEPQFFYAGRVANSELREVLDVLQSRIQDAILLTARMDADEPVPAKYRDLVNEYYQALSDDLR